MLVFKCKICGGNLSPLPENALAVCDSCGTTMTVPKDRDSRQVNLFNRANALRRDHEFDKAQQVYEELLNEDNTNAEAHWGVVLCKYGIDYVEDTVSEKPIPTCHRTHFEGILADPDYKQALGYGDIETGKFFSAEAELIDRIQKQILAISSNEEPFDVFICYKDKDEFGKTTRDRVLARDIFQNLSSTGMSVFFAAETLANKLGHEFEPYIFAALNSARVMVLVGTKPEYINAVWTKNEWSRFLALSKKEKNKVLITAYRDMDPYDLPEEIKHLQALDMSRIGFIQELTSGIVTILNGIDRISSRRSAGMGDDAIFTDPTVGSILRRAFICLEDGDRRKADEIFEKVLDLDPENAQAYTGKLLLEFHCATIRELPNLEEVFEESTNYKRAVLYGNEALENVRTIAVVARAERVETRRKDALLEACKQRVNEAKYSAELEKVIQDLETIVGHRNADQLLEFARKKQRRIEMEPTIIMGIILLIFLGAWLFFEVLAK